MRLRHWSCEIGPEKWAVHLRDLGQRPTRKAFPITGILPALPKLLAHFSTITDSAARTIDLSP